MILSSARGHPDVQTGRITDFSTFPGGESDPLVRRYQNVYGENAGVMTAEEQRNYDRFTLDKMNAIGVGNPKLWARLKKMFGL